MASGFNFMFVFLGVGGYNNHISDYPISEAEIEWVRYLLKYFNFTRRRWL